MRRATVLTTAVWALAVGVALLFAWQTKIRPILFRVTDRHGVHLGDVVAFAVTGDAARRVTRCLDAGRRIAGGPICGPTR
jgi:hypothetical protein